MRANADRGSRCGRRRAWVSASCPAWPIASARLVHRTFPRERLKQRYRDPLGPGLVGLQAQTRPPGLRAPERNFFRSLFVYCLTAFSTPLGAIEAGPVECRCNRLSGSRLLVTGPQVENGGPRPDRPPDGHISPLKTAGYDGVCLLNPMSLHLYCLQFPRWISDRLSCPGTAPGACIPTVPARSSSGWATESPSCPPAYRPQRTSCWS